MKELTDLPVYDIWPLIFRNLSIDDLFNCRLVSKKFKEFSDHTNGINKLIIGQPYSIFHDNYWFYDNKLIEDKDIISFECFKQIRSLSLFNLDKYLKYLKIYDQRFKSEELSNLINLESLEFGHNNYRNNQQNINLNNLKVFVSNQLSIKLNTPKLEKIQSYDMYQIQLDFNVESIKHVTTGYYDNKLEILKKLEIIELRFTQSINENLLIIFKNLKQLKINLDLDLDGKYYSDEEINNSLIKILNDKMKLRREIDIYLEGVKVEKMDKLNELKADKYPYWKFRLNNYDLLDFDLSFINYLKYPELERCVNNIENDLPSTFFDKFQYIRQVRVYDANDANGLNWFLNNLKYLTELTINSRISLDEVFYNNLPNTIKYLSIYNKEADINYDFILKLSKLVSFTTHVDKDLFDLAFTSFSNLKYLEEFSFYFKTNRIKIKNDGKYFYLDSIDEKLDYNQLIIECNKIRSK